METDYIWKAMMNKDIRYSIEDELYTTTTLYYKIASLFSISCDSFFFLVICMYYNYLRKYCSPIGQKYRVQNVSVQ